MDQAPSVSLVDRLIAQARGALRGALDLALPPACPACRAVVVDDGALCPQCWSKLSFITRPLCDRTGIPFAFDPETPLLSREAMAHPPAWSRARAATRFSDVSRDLVHALKYADRMEVARPMARFMVVAGAELLAEADVLAPAPLHWTRLWARRFNQAAVLADLIAKESGVASDPMLIKRIKRTPTQVGSDRLARRRNVEGAFAIPDPVRVRGRNILLIDDVLTTGATLDAMARVLTRAGAAKVNVLVFTRVVDPV